ncbi:MAG: O-methyltransferase [Chthoniobacterales bacterium]|nr:O-methyltransferase [Chthoniobacterales bacterium]
MSEETWSKVDRYFEELLLGEQPALDAALRETETVGLPAISVSPLQGRFLTFLAQSMGARRILELGTLGGYSTICLAAALPNDGLLVSLEVDPKNAEVARRNLERAQLHDRVEIRVAPAIETLPQLVRENAGPFDLIFIDADKESYADYFPWALKLARPGTVLLADNVVRKGEIIDAGNNDARIQGARRFNALVAAEPRVRATAMQTVGCKGYDGFLLAVVQ